MNKKKLLQIPICILILLISHNVRGQQLHHQMLSSMGSTNTLKSGMVIRQTVGQQSVIGNSTVSNLTLQQGFQQSLIFQSSPLYSVNTIVTTVYPNPFLGAIKIGFSQSIRGNMDIVLYNMFGLVVYNEERKGPASSITLNFGDLPAGSYVLQLSSKDYAYTKILIKL